MLNLFLILTRFCIFNKITKNDIVKQNTHARVRFELTTFRFLSLDYETDALPTALTRHLHELHVNVQLETINLNSNWPYYNVIIVNPLSIAF